MRTPMIRLLAALLLAPAMAPASASATPAGHALAPATRAAIAREATQMLAQPGVRHVGFYGFTIDRTGHVRQAWVVRPSGSPRLDRLALAAIRKAILKQRPKGAPARMQFVIPIEFQRGGRMIHPPTGTAPP